MGNITLRNNNTFANFKISVKMDFVTDYKSTGYEVEFNEKSVIFHFGEGVE